MEERLARIIANAAVRSAGELADLAPLLTDRDSGDLGENLKMALGASIAELYNTIVDPILAQFPKLKEEFEANMRRYDRFC